MALPARAAPLPLARVVRPLPATLSPRRVHGQPPHRLARRVSLTPDDGTPCAVAPPDDARRGMLASGNTHRQAPAPDHRSVSRPGSLDPSQRVTAPASATSCPRGIVNRSQDSASPALSSGSAQGRVATVAAPSKSPSEMDASKRPAYPPPSAARRTVLLSGPACWPHTSRVAPARRSYQRQEGAANRSPPAARPLRPTPPGP